jgi:hypothetical protein
MDEPERSIFRRFRWCRLDEIAPDDFDLRPKVLKELIPTWLHER